MWTVRVTGKWAMSSYMWVPWLLYMCAMTHSHVCHDSFIHSNTYSKHERGVATSATHYCNTLLQHTDATQYCNTLLQHTTYQKYQRSVASRRQTGQDRTATYYCNTLQQHSTATYYCNILLRYTDATHYCNTLLQHTNATRYLSEIWARRCCSTADRPRSYCNTNTTHYCNTLLQHTTATHYYNAPLQHTTYRKHELDIAAQRQTGRDRTATQ